jgi:hypothetical protein
MATQGTFSTPQQSNQSVYPYNNVTRSRSGHLFEVDDTLGEERIHQKHKSGTYYEIGPDGTHTTTVVSDRYTTVCGTDTIAITGDANIAVNGTVNLTINGNYNLEVNGNMSQTVKGEYKLKVGAAHKTEVGGDIGENIIGRKESVIGNGLINTVRAGGVTNAFIGGLTQNVVGDTTSICTGSVSMTGLTGMNLTSPAGPATLGGLSAGVDSATGLTLTGLGFINMYAGVTNMSTPLVNILGGALIASLDVRALSGGVGLATHIHNTPVGPTTPGFL